MSTCESCPLQEGCYEKRGLCRDYILYMERVEKVREQIEKLNENNTTSAVRAVPADKGGIQEAGGVHKIQTPEGGRGADSVQPAAGTAEKSEALHGEEALSQKRAGGTRGILDREQSRQAHRNV